MCDWLNSTASVASIVGLVITIWQLFSFKRKLNDAIIKNNETIEKTLRVISISDSIRLAENILHLIQADKLELALSKLMDLNKAVIDICESSKKSIRSDLSRYQLCIPSDIDSLREMTNGNSKMFVKTICSDIQKILDELQRIESSIKKI